MKKIYKILILIVSIIVISSISVFAYIKAKTESTDISVTTNITSNYTVDVSSLSDLIKYGTNYTYNESSKESNVISDTSTDDYTSRVILKLTSDITLVDNIVLNRDIQIDLNGKTLYLNGYTLTINHGYSGCCAIYNGTIDNGGYHVVSVTNETYQASTYYTLSITTDEDGNTTTTYELSSSDYDSTETYYEYVTGTGKIVIDLPYAGFEVSDLNYNSTNSYDNIFKILNLDSKYTAYNIFYLVGDALDSSLASRPRKLTYDEVSDSSFDITSSKLYIAYDSCSYNDTSHSNGCAFIYQDLILPTHYLSTDVGFSYSSSDTSIMSNNGILTGTNYGNVTLKATATIYSKFTGESFTSDTTYYERKVSEITAYYVKTNDTTYDSTKTYYTMSEYTTSYLLHVININDSDTKQKVGLILLKNYLNSYYTDDTLYINSDTSFSGYYRFDQGITLPATALGGNITYSYTTSGLTYNETDDKYEENSNYAITLYYYETSDNTLVSGKTYYYISNGEYTKFEGTSFDDNTTYYEKSVYKFEPSDNDYYLNITINSSATATQLPMHSTYVGINEAVAYYIANELYGGSIVYDKASNGKQLVTFTYDSTNSENSGYTYTSDDTSKDYTNLISYMKEYNVTSVSYSIKDGSAVSSNYALNESSKLTVNDGASPSDKEGYITMTITIDGIEYSIDLYIEYLDSSGSTLSNYLTYYTIYNALVDSELETSFTLPFATNGIAPYTCYDVATYTTSTEDGTTIIPTLYKPDNLKIEFYASATATSPAITFEYGYTEANITAFADGVTYYTRSGEEGSYKYEKASSYVSGTTYYYVESFTEQLDSYLKENSTTLATLASAGAYYKFSIDVENSLDTNTNLVLLYNYKFDNDNDWNKYQAGTTYTDNNTTYFTVLGGLFYDEDGTKSNAVKDSNFFIWIYNKYKPDDRKEIDSSSSDIIIPIDWLGQEATISSSDTDLSNVSNFSGIEYLTGITEVDLAGTDLSKSESVLTGISKLKYLTTLNLSGCTLDDDDLKKLSNLSNYNTLKTLDISNNSIEYFDSITSITSLEKVYLYGNNTDSEYIGSLGICNYQAYTDLMRNGCDVYYTTSGDTPVLYEDSNSINDYRRLKEIAYQDKLSYGVSITNLYSAFISLGTSISSKTGTGRVNNTNPFGLQTEGTLSWGYEGDTTEGTGYIEADPTNYYTRSGEEGSYTYSTASSFEANKTYYEKNGDSYNAITLYILSDGTYTKVEDTSYDANTTYYIVASEYNATYFYVTLTYSSNYILKVKYYVDRY